MFRKYGFNRQLKESFTDLLDQLQTSQLPQYPNVNNLPQFPVPNMHYFLPINNSHPYRDATLQPVAVAPHQNMGSRLVDLVANTSKITTSERGIVERSFKRVKDMKLSGDMFPIAHQLTYASGVQPTPDLPVISIWLDVMCVLRRLGSPYLLRYGLAPGVTYADHGRDLLARLLKENVLCSTKQLTFNRPNPYALVSNAELINGSVRLCNLLDSRQTQLPMLTTEQLMGVTLGPFSVDNSHGYWTDYQEEDTLVGQLGNYQNPTNFHQQASQVIIRAF